VLDRLEHLPRHRHPAFHQRPLLFAAWHSPAPLGFGIVGLGSSSADFHAEAIADAAGAQPRRRLRPFGGRNPAPSPKNTAQLSPPPISPLSSPGPISTSSASPPPAGPTWNPPSPPPAPANIIIEKPIEITLARMDELLAGVAAAGVKMMPIFQARFGEGAGTVKAAIAAGRLGRLTLASAYVERQRSAA